MEYRDSQKEYEYCNWGVLVRGKSKPEIGNYILVWDNFFITDNKEFLKNLKAEYSQ